MSIATTAETMFTIAAPLRRAEGGVIRVGNTRISLDLVVQQYENGVTPEQMVRAHDSLSLADVYAAIAYYLSNRENVKGYLDQRKAEAESLRAMAEAERPPITRAALEARRSEIEHAPTGQ